MMKKVCTICGTEYPDDASWCNACRQESLVAVEEPAEEGDVAPLRDDTGALVTAAFCWLVGLGYLLGIQRPRTAVSLFLSWALLVVITTIVGLILRNVRAFVFFSLFGLAFVVIYGLVKL